MSKTIEITAKKEINGVPKSATIFSAMGETAAERIEMFGDQVVNSNFISEVKVSAQAVIRRFLEKGKTQDEITALMATWKPGVAMDRTVDVEAAAIAKYESMSKDKQDAFIEKLMSRQK